MRGFAALLIAGVLFAPTYAALGVPGLQSTERSEGLPGEIITAIAESTDGILWVGTDEGLSRVRAGEFVPAEGGAPASTYVHALMPVDDGTLWVAGNAGLWRMASSGEWDRGPGGGHPNPDAPATALHQSGDGAVWVGGRSTLTRWDGRGWTTVASGIPMVQVITDDGELVWVGASNELLRFTFAGARSGQVRLDGELAASEVSSLLEADGQLWIGTTLGLAVGTSDSFEPIDDLVGTNVRALAADPREGIWVATASGLLRVVSGTIAETVTTFDGLAGDISNTLVGDRDGNLWVGTNGGLTRIPLQSWWQEAFVSIADSRITALMIGPDGAEYVAVPGGLLARPAGGEWRSLPHESEIRALAAGGSAGILVGSDTGLETLSADTFNVDERIPAGSRVTAIAVAANEVVWAGTEASGVWRLNADDIEQFSADTAHLQDGVSAVWIGADGDVYVGLTNGGIAIYGNGEWTQIDSSTDAENRGLASNIIFSGLEDPGGNLWVGTAEGLSYLPAGADASSPEDWRTYLPGTAVYQLAHAISGRVWAGGPDGLDLVDPELGASHFNREDGLSSSDINSLAIRRDGTLLVGATPGLTYHRDAGIAPHVEVLSLSADGQPCAGLGTTNGGSLDCTSGVPWDSKIARFQYVGADLADHGRIRYRSEIADPSGTGTAVLVGQSVTAELVEDSRYGFRVQAIDAHFNESDWTSLAELAVDPMPFSESGWFIVLLVTAAAALVAVVAVIVWRWRLPKPLNILDARLSITEAEVGYSVSLTVPPDPLSVTGTATFDSPEIDLQSDRLHTPHGNVEAAMVGLGQALWQALPDDVRIRVDRTLASGWLRLRITAGNDSRIGNLPWELLHDGTEYLALGTAAIVRALPPEASFEPARQEHLKALIVWASPTDRPPLLAINKEIAAIESAFESWGAHWTVLANVTIDAFSDHMDEGYDIVHFVGHGEFRDHRGVVSFCDQDGDALAVGVAEIGHLFSANQGGPATKLVVLNACQSADNSSVDGVLGLAADIVTTSGVPAVIGMGYPVSDLTAATFAQKFYKVLAYSGQVDQAVTAARNELRALKPGLRDWATPRLYLGTDSSTLFDVIRGWRILKVRSRKTRIESDKKGS